MGSNKVITLPQSYISWKNKGERFTFYSSFYVEDAAFVSLSREDVEKAIVPIYKHFKRSGLTIHTGSVSKKDKSKSEFMHIPGAGQT